MHARADTSEASVLGMSTTRHGRDPRRITDAWHQAGRSCCMGRRSYARLDEHTGHSVCRLGAYCSCRARRRVWNHCVASRWQVFETAGQVRRYSISTTDVPYNEMTSHCEALLEGKEQKIASSFGAVCGKDIISDINDLVFSFLLFLYHDASKEVQRSKKNNSSFLNRGEWTPPPPPPQHSLDDIAFFECAPHGHSPPPPQHSLDDIVVSFSSAPPMGTPPLLLNIRSTTLLSIFRKIALTPPREAFRHQQFFPSPLITASGTITTRQVNLSLHPAGLDGRRHHAILAALKHNLKTRYTLTASRHLRWLDLTFTVTTASSFLGELPTLKPFRRF
ncbi:hypothetical protein ACLOJK_015109 [Asimina triloba]